MSKLMSEEAIGNARAPREAAIVGGTNILNDGSSRPSLGRELVQLLVTNKKWWLAPIVFAMLIIGALVMLGGSAAAPFIYTLF